MANFNFNKVILGGRLTADPELRQTPQGISVTTFSIAVNRRFTRTNDGSQPTADFFNCTAWRSNAEFITRYFKKGNSICVVGTLQNRSWTDQQTGQKRYATDIVVDEANFVDSKEAGLSAPMPNDAYNAPAYSSQETEAPKFEELSNDDDLPF